MKVFSHEGDGENTEHLNSMDLHDIKTELERDAEAEKAEVCVHNQLEFVVMSCVILIDTKVCCRCECLAHLY